MRWGKCADKKKYILKCLNDMNKYHAEEITYHNKCSSRNRVKRHKKKKEMVLNHCQEKPDNKIC